MSSGRLAGQVAWISGATSGIGAAAARLFAQEGAAVALIGRRFEMSRAIAAEINASGGRAVAIACDVSREDQVRGSIEETVAAFGGLGIVVNNAGMVGVKLLHEYSEEEWDYLMAVNVKSMFFATKHAMAHLRNSRRSYIVNVGSISSFVGQASTPVYTTSKHAVLGLTRSIALDYAADGVRCNCVCPGITDTPMLREHLGFDPRSRGDAGRPAPPRGDGRGADAPGRGPLHPLFQLRGFFGRDRDFADDRLRLPDCRRMGNQGKNRFHGADMPLKLACADFAFPLLRHDQVLDLIAMLRFDGVDVGLFEGRSHLWPSREFANVSRSARQLGRKLADRGLRAADVFLQTAPDFTPYAINHPQPARRRKARGWFLQTLDYAAGCGAGHVTLLPGVYFDDEPRAASWRARATSWHGA